MQKSRLRMNQLINFFYKGYNFFLRYPTPPNLGSVWNFGVTSLVFFVLQFFTGIFLSMYYIPHADFAFLSVENIMRNVNYGWLVRYLHSTGASFFFLCVYIHIFRSLYYCSFNRPRYGVWCIGVILLILMIATAFTGYVLPWGQMSFWAATVITNLFSAVPFFGDQLVCWLWGGYAVNTYTLNRFFTFHFCLAFLLVLFIGLHLILLHARGSSNNLGLSNNIDKVNFHPFFTSKDLLFISFIAFISGVFVGFLPNYMLHSDNYIMADPLSTPPHIVPEWYFSPFYAILRSVPNKTLGIVLLLLSIMILFIFPLLLTRNPMINDKFPSEFFGFNFSEEYTLKLASVINRRKRVIRFWIFVVVVITLGVLGGLPITKVNLLASQVLVFLYFLYFYLVCAFHIWEVTLVKRQNILKFFISLKENNKLIRIFVTLYISCLWVLSYIIPFLCSFYIL